MPELERLPVTRVVATPVALDAAAWDPASIVLRTDPDEALVVDGELPAIDDRWAIVVPDAGWCGVWLDAAAAERFLDHACAWERPLQRPAFAQGMIAQLPVKLWLESDRVLVMTVQSLAAELGGRIEILVSP